MDRPRVYLETTIPSYLTAWPSRDLLVAAHQQVTREWWKVRRSEFELYVSGLVIEEAGAGDEEAAAQRLEILEEIPLLELSEEVVSCAGEFVRRKVIPENKGEDALHVAAAAVHGMDYLLTWNLKHIAGAVARKQIEWTCRSVGYEPPGICTPEELMER